jgi:hypothetical protein
MSADAFGRALRRRRAACGLTVRGLAAKVHYSKSHLSDLENAVRLPHRTLAVALDEVLKAGGELVRLLPGGPPFTTADHGNLTSDVPLDGDGGLEAMKRRTLLGLGSVAGLGIVAPGITSERADVAVGEWGEIVTEYGYSYMTTAPTEVLRSLTADLVALQRAAQQRTSAADLRSLRRNGAYLAGFMAMSMGDLGHLRQAQRWWRSARRVADDSGDLHAILWVRAREIVRGIYERRPTTEILALVTEAEQCATPAAPATAVVELVIGKAQVLGLAGRGPEAAEALAHLQDRVFPQLPSRVAADRNSLFGWPEERMRFGESFAYSFLGDHERASQAQDRAVQLYPASFPRGRAQIELQRAICLVHEGDVAAGVGHARSVLAGLPAEHHNRPVDDLGQRVLEAVGASDRRRPAVTEYADYLATPS